MNCLRLVKRLGTSLTISEQKQAAKTLADCSGAIRIIKGYLEREVISVDKQLNDTNKLYSQEGDTHLLVATMLAKRETQMKLLNLLSEEVELDADPAGD